jgi:hypothetical protein
MKTHRRFAILLCPDTATESEIYAEVAEDASNLFALLSASPETGRRASGDRYPTSLTMSLRQAWTDNRRNSHQRKD